MYKQIFFNDLKSYLDINNISAKINILYSDYEDFQYQSSILLSCKNIDKDNLITFLSSKPHYDKISITGTKFLSVKFNLKNLNILKSNHPQKILVDYCGVNVAKKMHIGHIRSMFIGDYIARLHEFIGDQVIKVNHIGDWGNQFGYLLHYIQLNQLENTLNNQNLTDYYKKSNTLYKENKHFANQSDIIAYQLQHNLNPSLHVLWKKCVDISMMDAENIFNHLNIKLSHQDTKGESFYASFCNDIVNDLLSKKIAHQSEDKSIVVFFEDKSPLVLQKSNGNFLYALYDLAALKWRQDNYSPNKIIYVTDNRQELHFQQVFDIAKKAEYVKKETILQHVSFGTILGKDKKPLKTREGDPLYLETLLEEGKNILLNSNYFKTIEPKIKEEVLQKNIIGGMKFYDLKFNKSQDYIFDWDNVLNFSGGSAPYIQNALTRIDSIFYNLNLELTNIKDLNLSDNWDEDEEKIIFQCQKCFEVISDSVNNYSSQSITENTIKLCQLFHHYYEKEIIIGHPQQIKKTNLLNYIYNTIKTNIDILGIESFQCKQKIINSSNLKHLL